MQPLHFCLPRRCLITPFADINLPADLGTERPCPLCWIISSDARCPCTRSSNATPIVRKKSSQWMRLSLIFNSPEIQKLAGFLNIQGLVPPRLQFIIYAQH
uniref:Uncharacterized protein n=1 Tax=Rhizophora mucronata TaxID=61149 RepID=A0A2P2ISF2_RHIMU